MPRPYRNPSLTPRPARLSAPRSGNRDLGGRARHEAARPLPARAAVRARTMLAAMLCAMTCMAAAAGTEPDPDRWHVVASPYLWAGSLRGHADVAGRRADFHLPFSTIFDDLDFSFMGNAEATNGRYGFYLDNVYTSLGQRNAIDGVSTHARLRANWLTAGAFMRVYEQALGGDTLAGTPRVFAVEPTAGLRWTSMHGALDSPIGDASSRVNWTDPFVGLRVQADLDERWNLSAEADIGGFGVGSRLSANGQAYLGYRVRLFGYDTMLRLGYRALYQDYREHTDYGRAKWANTLQGPVAGLSVRF
ncbi:hypothetical protein [Achromobacter aloeverae]